MELTWQEPLAAARPRAIGQARLACMYQAHADPVWRVLRRMGLEPAQADDGLQQVFLVAQERLDDIAPKSELAFLVRVALRVGARLKLVAWREEPSEAVLEAPAPLPAADEVLALRRKRQLLDRVLAQLPEELRTVLVLCEVEGLCKREVALALQIPEGTAASRLRRARVAFQEQLELLSPLERTR